MELRRMQQMKSNGWLKALYIKYSAFCVNLPTNCACGLEVAMAKSAELHEKGDSGLLQCVRTTRIKKGDN